MHIYTYVCMYVNPDLPSGFRKGCFATPKLFQSHTKLQENLTSPKPSEKYFPVRKKRF